MSNYWKKKLDELNKSNSSSSTKKETKTSNANYWQKKMDELEADDDIAPVVTTKKKDDDDRKWFQKGAFEDGYQFGDVTKTILGTVTDTVENLGTGIVGMGERVVDALAYVAPYAAKGQFYQNGGAYQSLETQKMFDKSIEESKKGMESFIKKDLYDEQKVARKIIESTTGVDASTYNAYSVLGDRADAMVQSAGAWAATQGLQLVGIPWFVTTGLTSFGGEAESALQEGASSEEAFMSSTVSAGADILGEYFFGGMFGETGMDDMLVKQISRSISNKFFRDFATVTTKGVGEGLEEEFSLAISRFGKWLTYQNDKTLKDMFLSEEAVDEAVDAFLGGFLLGGGKSTYDAIKSNKGGVDYASGLTANEQKVVDKVYADRVAEAEKNGKVTRKEKSKIYDAVIRDMDRGYISTDTIEEVLGGETYKSYQSAIEEEDSIRKVFDSLNQMKQGEMTGEQLDMRNEMKRQLDEIKSKDQRNLLKTQLGEEVFGMVNGDRLVESYLDKERAYEDFKADFDKFKGVKHEDAARATLESAIKAGVNNRNRVHDIVDMAAKLAGDTGMRITVKNGEQIKTDFIERQTKEIAKIESIPEAQRTAEQSKELTELQEMLEDVKSGKAIVNGNITDDGIDLNLDSPDALNRTVGHEITHSLEKSKHYQQLRDHLFKYARERGVDIERELKSRALKYKGIANANPEAELVADLIGEYVFSDTDYVSRLSSENRNVFQRMYDEVKYLCKIVTAGSKEARELEKVKRAFEQALREGGKAQSETKYSISDSDGKQLSKEQQEYFKDSKMRDENGNLKVMYHGSQDAGFHVFDAKMSDDDTSFFFVDRNDVAASYSGTTETYEAKTIRTAEDMNNFLAEIGQDEDYNVIEKDGEFILLYDGDRVAASDTAQGIYEEFCWYEGVGEGDANYKVYLNLKNPLVVDAQGRPWNKIDAEFSQEVYDRFNSLTGEEKDALHDLAEWEDFRIFNSEIQEARDNELASAYQKMGEDVNIYDLFSAAADNFSEESIRENSRKYLKTRDYAQRAKEQGYDGVIFNNIVDNGGYSNGSEGASTVAIAFDSNQIKSVANEKPTADADIRYSLSSIANTFFGDENMSANQFMKQDYKQTQGYKDYVEQCVNNYRQTRADFDEGVARKEIEDGIAGIVDVAIAAKKAGYDIYDDKTKRNKKDSKNRLLFSSLEPNSDYFTSHDISAICDKRKNFAGIYDDIVRAEEAKGVPQGKRFFDNVDNYFYLHKLMADRGLTQPCRQCYVESMRKNLAPMADAFLRLVKETDPDNTANDQLYHQKGKNKGGLKTNNASTREWVLATLGEYDMSVNDLTIETLTTADGLAELKIRAPMIYEAFNSFYGQSKPKMPKAATPFRFGELTALLTDERGKIKQSVVDKINSTGGFRFQSYSDFQIQNYVDVLQVIFEAGTLGLNGHSYTKVPSFLDATAGTNLKRNISIFMYKDGNEWKLDRNDSFPYTLEEIYDIVNADKSGNTGIIAVSQNEDMSAWIMANDYVGYGIPFHKSGLKMGTVRDTIVKEDGREIKGYSGIKDHTKQQTEVWAKASEDHKALTKVKNGINIYRFWDFDNKSNLSKQELIEKNVKAYIDACELAGYLPKFREYVMNNGKVLNNVLEYSKKLGFASQDATIEDISFEYKGYRIPYGYYKFLGDFGMFTPDGKASTHETLSLKNYDFKKAVEFFSDAENLRRNEILQQFSNGEERERYRGSNLSAEELADIVKQKRQDVVRDVVGDLAPAMSLSGSGGQFKPYGSSDMFSGDWQKHDIAPTVSETESVAENATTTSEKTTPVALYNMRDGENGWGDVYATAQEALGDAVQYANQELWDAIGKEIENSVGKKRSVTPMTNALIAVQEDVRQQTITPMQGAQLLSEAYNHGGAETLGRLYNPKTGNLYNQYLEKAKQYETAAPVNEAILSDDIAPIDDDAYQNARLASLTDADAPPETEAPYYESEEVTADDPFDDRDWYEVGNKKVKAYMYENPEVKPFFQEEAQAILGELSNTTKGERWYNNDLYYETNGEMGFGGVKRQTSDTIAEMLDSWGMSYADIEKGLNAIIEDHGAENIAAAKKIEFMLNDRLLNGYKDFFTGDMIPPNEDYIRLLNEKQVTEYSKEAFDAFMANADDYAPAVEEDISPVATTKESSAVEVPVAPTFDAQPRKGVVEGQQAMFEEPKVPEKITRSGLHQNIIDNIKSRFKASGFDFDRVLKTAKNLSTFATVDNTPQRVMEKALGYKEGQLLSDITVNQVAQNETEGIKWLNSYTDRKNGVLAQLSKKYGIKAGSKESAAAQMYAEGFYVGENNDIIEYGDAELAKDFPDSNVQANIKGLANDPVIRAIYDETLSMINESRTRNAYPEIQRLDNYFLHFRAMDDTFSRLGLPFNPNDIRAKDLPTDLNGVTADLKPGQPYFASAMHRTGKRTSFDLLGGLERYLSSAKNQIYHIDDIQTLRALRNYIADTYGQASGLEHLDTLSEEEQQERINQVYGSHLSTFAKFLNEEANILAGKTALIDRGLEGIIGRRGITFLDTINKQVGSNMVGFNVSSSLTNFLPVAQTFAKTNKFAFTKAFAQTVAHKVSRRSDGFAENSPVMIRRKGADRFYRTPWQKMSDPAYVLMSAVDDISTELIARTKYNELVKNGMDSQTAHYETDKWVSRLMGDRSLGQQPQIYNSKMLGLVTKFQLEVRNQLDSQFYDTIQETKVSNEHIENELARNAKTAAKVASTFVQLAAVQHLFGKAFESVAGYNPAFDIIEVLMTAFGFDDDEESEDTALDNIEQGFLALLEDLPYASTFLDGGRIPISAALPVGELVKGVDEWGNEKSRWETLGEIAPYYALPAGYGQIKKTAQGLGMFSEDHPIAGSYTDSGNLRFPVEDTLGNRVQAGIFGQWANDNARDYFDNERQPLKKKQIEEFIDLDMPIRAYWDYREGLKEQETLEDKFDYIAGLDLSVEQKNIMINNVVDRKEDVDMANYDDFDSYEEFDFYTKNKEKYEFLEANGVSYAEYKSSDDAKEKYDAVYSWYKNNPEKVSVAKVVTDNMVEYRSYTSALNDIRADKDKNGKSISGTAKDKKVDYINSLDIDYGQRLILFKSEYPADDTYNNDIIDYLNGRDDLTYNERVTILKELGFTVTSDGYIYWD